MLLTDFLSVTLKVMHYKYIVDAPTSGTSFTNVLIPHTANCNLLFCLCVLTSVILT